MYDTPITWSDIAFAAAYGACLGVLVSYFI